MKIKILTDLSTSIPKDIVDKNNIEIVPIKLNWEGKEINSNKELFQEMRGYKGDDFPKTSQPSIGDFKKVFDENLKENDYILCFCLSSGLSGTYNSALQAKKFLGSNSEKVIVIDSLLTDAALGILIIETIKLIDKKLEISGIVDRIEKVKEKIQLFGFVETPDWLERGGRLKKTTANIVRQAQKIGIRPLIELKKGSLGATSLKLKAKDKNEALLKELEKRVDNKKAFLTITHADNIEDANKLKTSIEKDFPNIEILYIEEICSVIGSHVGPDTLIICFLEK